MAAIPKPRILIADDSEMNRAILTDMLEAEYDIIEAEDGVQAVAALEEHGPTLSLVLLDIIMPNMDGFGVLNAMNEKGWINDIPVIMISSESRSSSIEQAYNLGITDYINRPFDAAIVHHRVVNTIILYAKQKKLISLVEEQVQKNTRQSSLMIDILSHIVEFRNGESGMHVVHIRTITELILRYLARKTDHYALSEQDISLISTASALHDIGKIAIPDSILNKPGRLTSEEFAIMKTHSMTGATMLEELGSHQDEPLVKAAYEICRWHHERYDGRGYPDGLVGEQIPIGAQVVSLADVYDALTSERVYKAAIPHEKAISMILNGECGAFSPLLLECLTDLADRLPAAMAAPDAPDQKDSNMQKLTDEMIHREAHTSTEQTRVQLDLDRMNFNTLAAISRELEFEYTVAPSHLTLTSWTAELLGLPESIPDPMKDPRLQSYLDPGLLSQLRDAVSNADPANTMLTHIFRLPLQDQPRWFRLTCQLQWIGGDTPRCVRIIGRLVDIDDLQTKLLELEHLASYDALTGLYNRSRAHTLILDQLTNRPDQSFVLAVIDLDNFKLANDARGHQFGDQLLTDAAMRLQICFDHETVIARIGGDEFLVFSACTDTCRDTFRSVFAALGQPYGDFNVTASMGLALTDDVGYSYDALFRAADLALYSAKHAGRNCVRLYDPSLDALFYNELPNN